MKIRKMICTVLSAAMLSSVGFIPVQAESSGGSQAQPAEEEMTAYLFAYFRRPPGQRDDERLCYGVSRDGYTFRALNGGEPVFTSTLGYKALRDPFIMRGEDGYFYIIVTDLLGTSNPNSTIGIYKTADLINMEESVLINFGSFDGFGDITRAWAPQAIWCPEHDNGDGTQGAYMVYLAIYSPSNSEVGTVMYRSFTTDLMDQSKYTAPEMMLAGQETGSYAADGAIDGDITYDPINDRYLMYFDGNRVAASETVDGIYTELKSSPFTSGKMEGSNIYKLLDEDKWLICADGQSFGTGFNVYETTDFYAYTDVRGEVDYDFTPRHGYVIPITESELEDLMDEYGYVYLPDKNDPSPLDDLTLPYTEDGYKIAGNITLPEEINGTEITWTSSDESIISTEKREFSEEEKTEYGENYTEIPAGVVTRPEKDTEITLTASTADGDERKFEVTVKAAPEKSYKEMQDDGDFTGYLYASFIEPPLNAQGQQVYFASSDDGMNWMDLNDNEPVLTSTMGTGSTRDHYILRSPEGDRFYLLATDLNCVEAGKDWTDYAQRGSKSLMIWESDDLVNWSEQRMVQIADDDTGCAWAPEAIYDEITGEYVVYWSGEDIDPESPDYGKKVVYASRTRDFYSFGEQQKFVMPTETDGVEAGTSDSFIDTTMIQGSDGNFYRVTKYENVSPTRVFMDVSKYPLGEFTRVETNLDEETFLGTEGPGWFKLNEDDAERLGKKYCLMLDGYNGPNKGVGFFPTVVDDLNNTNEINFERVTENYSMRTSAKHGGIIQLTQEEYDRVNEAYKNSEREDLSSYISEANKEFDIAQSYPDYPDGWTIPSDSTLDNDSYRFLGFNGSVEMSGYGEGADWTAITFDMAANSKGDTVIYDLDGNAVFGYCYAEGGDGFWVGHGERNYGGTVNDSYGVKRLPNYLKTEIGPRSDRDDTGHTYYSQYDDCVIIMENMNGSVDSYTGDYYTVKTYVKGILVSTEYYSGHFNGIGGIESNAKQYYGNLCIYCEQEDTPDVPVDDKFKLFEIDFDDETTEASVGAAQAIGNVTADDGTAYLDGASYLSVTNKDGSPLLKGKDSFVVTMRAKIEDSGTNGWYFYTAPNDNAQVSSRRVYAGLYDGYNNMVSERFLNNNGGVPTVQTPSQLGEWREITLVFDGYSQELYINGRSVGTAEYGYTISDILGDGDDQITYIGKANWGSGEYLKGNVDDIAIYDFAPRIELGDLSEVTGDIELPTASAETDGYTISWKSSDEAIITSDGKVTRPEDGDRTVRLTATISFGKTALEKTYEATVKERDQVINLTSLSNSDGMLSYELTPRSDFDAEMYDVYTAVYDDEGRLISVSKNEMSGSVSIGSSKHYRIKVMLWEKDSMRPAEDFNMIDESTKERSTYMLASYTTDGSEYYGSAQPAIGNSLHLAVSNDGGETYEPLNSNVGVLFAEADYSENAADPLWGDTKMLRDPYLFRLKDGGYGVIAAREDASGNNDETDGSAAIYTSEDLTEFFLLGYVALDSKAIYEPVCVFEDGAYRISWSDSDGGPRKSAMSEDLLTIGEVSDTDEVYSAPRLEMDCDATNELGLTETEYESLVTALNAPKHVGFADMPDTEAENGSVSLPETVTALYNDGSEQEFPVTWDTSSVDFSEPGEYTVTGTVTAKDYPTNFITDRADPCVLRSGDRYYFVATRDNGDQTVLYIRTADTLDGLAAAEDHELWSNGGDLIWAPEIHEADGRLMIFFATGRDWSRVQSHVMVLEGEDPLSADAWSEPVRIKKSDGVSNLIDDGITLDMTFFEWQGKYYVSWSQRRVNCGNVHDHESANIYIAEYDPSQLGRLAGDAYVISRPTMAWERTSTAVDEGPFTIVNDGTLYMTIAANGTNSSYGIKLMTLRDGGDPLNAEDWAVKGYPLLCTAMNTAEPGPGHSSFTVDENGDPVLVYHWGTRGSHRTTTIKNVHFNPEGEPVLNIPRGEQLAYNEVSIKVIVK